MAINWRTASMMGGILLAGVAAGAVGMMSLRGGDGPAPAQSRAMGAGASTTAFFTAVAGNCEMVPMLPNRGEGDGGEVLQSKPAGASSDEVSSLILTGKEAAAAGRQRDAEVAFLNACRNAAALKDSDGIPLADAMYQLARHYATVGAFGAAKGNELYQRAERLYSASLEAYRARYGADHEKTKFAQEGLTTVQHATGGRKPAAIAKAPPAPAPAPAPVVIAPAPEVPAPAPAVVAAPAAPPVTAAPAAPKVEAAKAEPAKPAAPAAEVARAPEKEPAKPAAAPAPARPAPATARPATTETRPAPAEVSKPAAPEEPRPRVQPRRAPPRTAVADAESEPRTAPAVAEPAPAPRITRRAEPEAEPQLAAPPAPPPAASMGGAAEAPTAEGSTGTE